MLERFSARISPLTTRASELAPVAPACCNVCRTCTTTNIVGLVLGGAAAAGVGLQQLVRRTPKRD